MARRWIYHRLNAHQLLERVEGLGWSLQRFAFVYGVPLQRAKDWSTGKEDIPHLVGLVLRLIRMPGGRSIAFEYAKEMAEETERHTAWQNQLEQRAANGEFDDRWVASDD